MKIAIAACAAILVSLNVSAQTVNDVNTKYNEAAALVTGKKYAEAIPVLNETIELGLKVPEAMETVTNAQKLLPVCYYMKGGLQMKAGQYEAAVADFEKAVETGELYGDITRPRPSTKSYGKRHGWLHSPRLPLRGPILRLR